MALYYVLLALKAQARAKAFGNVMPVEGAFTVTAYICVNCQQRNPSECRIFTGPDAKRCVIGHINGTKACRNAQAGHTEILVPYNARDRIVGGSGTAAPRHGQRQRQSQAELESDIDEGI